MLAQRRRLALALLLSLLIHTLLLSLVFGGQEPGLPGFALPWQERRIEAPDLRVVLMPAPATAAAPAGPSIDKPARQASIEQPMAVAPAPILSVSPGPAVGRTAEAVAPEPRPAPEAKPEANVARVAVAATASLRGSDETAPPSAPQPAVIAVERTEDATSVVPAAAPVPKPVFAAASAASNPQHAMPAHRAARDAARQRIDATAQARAAELAERESVAREAQAVQLEVARVETAQQEAARQEARRVERARLDAASQEAARQEAVRLETERLEVERLAAARQEAAREEAARQEARRIESARLEAQRQEAARLAAAQAAQQAAARLEVAREEARQVETARLEAERKEVERQAAARQEVARQEAARQESARVEAAETARREAARRAIGRQLDEEAARREAASAAAELPSRLPPSSSAARRGRLFGRTDPNAELILYAEAWARKIQLNMTFDMVRDAAKRPHTQPLVTVAIRSDGSVESVTFVMSSGVAEIDEAIRRIVQSQLPYPAFPPALAREFDVIEIRRTWHFDMAVRLY